MTSPDEDNDDKPHEASRKKLEDARNKGQIVRSQDATNLLILIAMTGAIVLVFSVEALKIAREFIDFVTLQIVGQAELQSAVITTFLLETVSRPILLMFALPLAVMLSILIAIRRVTFTATNLQFKSNRLSLIGNAKKKFGKNGLVEFLKSLLKFVLVSGYFAILQTSDYSENFHIPVLLDKNTALLETLSIAKFWLFFMVGAYCAFALVDVAWQIHAHAQQNRMSHKELKDEYKNEEGDQNIKQQRRSKAEEIATNRMLLDVPRASVVITNPTHYAVALSWSGSSDSVPKCVARGSDEVARRIRELAIQSGVPIYCDPPTARDLYANVKIGMFIERNHYKAVAAAIGYARRIQKMVRDEKR